MTVFRDRTTQGRGRFSCCAFVFRLRLPAEPILRASAVGYITADKARCFGGHASLPY